MSGPLLRRRGLEDLVRERPDPVDAETLGAARRIVQDVKERGQEAVREHAERLGDLRPGDPMVLGRDRMRQALEQMDASDRELLERTASRIRHFATMQRESLVTVESSIPGGRAGHEVAAVARAGCYAPGGRFPLPSSVLMTAVTARTAGVREVWVASPRPAPATLAAAAVADADGLLAVGGAQAIAALTCGAGDVPACDVVVGPGNRWVTAAKQIVCGRVGIDMLAGPSELVVLADSAARPDLVAADLLAQAEHDPDALPVLVTTSDSLAKSVEGELERQLADLPTADTARQALKNGFVVLVGTMDEAILACDVLAPEHLELNVQDPAPLRQQLQHWGGLFVGEQSAEVLGDYGAGPNHTLPTGGSARHSGGLSVLDFLRVRTWVEMDDPEQARELYEDAERLGRMEGLEAHARAARMRRR